MHSFTVMGSSCDWWPHVSGDNIHEVSDIGDHMLPHLCIIMVGLCAF